MKILYLLFFPIVLIPNFLLAQTYYDAIKLSTYYDSYSGFIDDLEITINETDTLDSEWVSILKKYIEPSFRDSANNSADFNEYFKSNGNTFLLPYFPDGGTRSTDDEKLPTTRENFVSNIANLNVTTIADGAAQFLIERANQELTIAYFSKLKEKIKPDSDLGILLPTTAEYLNQFKPLEFAAMLSTIREAFIEDLNNLPTNIPMLEKNHSAVFAKNEVKLFLVGLELLEPLKEGNDIATILNYASSSTHLNNLGNKELQTISGSLRLLNLISQSFLSEKENKVWVNYLDIEKLLTDSTTSQIYFGLIYQQLVNENIEINGQKVATLFANEADRIDNLKHIIREFNNEIQTLNNSLKTVQAAIEQGEKLSLEQFYDYSSEVIDLLNVIKSFESLVTDSLIWPSKEVDEFLYFAKKGNSIINNLTQKNYASLVMDVSIVLDSINISLNKDLIKYGTFVANVASAESSEEVTAAIKTAVLPVGSYRIKRSTKINTSINAYLGGFAGYEVLREIPEGEDKGTPIFGISAPIGVSFSFGTRTKTERKEARPGDNSFSLFISILDIGAFVSYRLQGDEVEELPEFELQNIIAPGASLAWNIPNSPLTFSTGAQLGPQLRKIGTTIENSEIVPVTSNAWRIFASLSVDIPLFNLKTVPWD